MNILIIIAIIVVAFFLLTFLIYWFNLDTKLVKLLEKPFKKHYDNIGRDRRI